jgi:hypothetical protein
LMAKRFLRTRISMLDVLPPPPRLSLCVWRLTFYESSLPTLTLTLALTLNLTLILAFNPNRLPLTRTLKRILHKLVPKQLTPFFPRSHLLPFRPL